MVNRSISSRRFDGARVWRSLSAETQARIGAAALEKAVAQAIFDVDYGKGSAGRAAESALEVADKLLQAAATGEGGLLYDHWIVVDQDMTFRLPSVLGLVCHCCGCSTWDPSEEGGGWESEIRCTACAGSAGEEDQEASDAAPPG